jgi:hypothetical protein
MQLIGCMSDYMQPCGCMSTGSGRSVEFVEAGKRLIALGLLIVRKTVQHRVKEW